MTEVTKSLAPARFAAAAAVAVAVAVMIVPLSAGGATQAKATAVEPSTAKVVSLNRTMDRLWQDHVTWTRQVIVSFAAGTPDLKPAIGRLSRNQVDIGNAIKPFYGAKAGSRLTSLLQTHIKQAVPVLTAAKNGDKAALKKALADWYANAHQIAAFLSRANPTSWPLAATTKMMDEHLTLTVDEAVARLRGNWKADIAAYDRVRAEILMMSRTLAEGIVAQFPGRFS